MLYVNICLPPDALISRILLCLALQTDIILCLTEAVSSYTVFRYQFSHTDLSTTAAVTVVPTTTTTTTQNAIVTQKLFLYHKFCFSAHFEAKFIREHGALRKRTAVRMHVFSALICPLGKYSPLSGLGIHSRYSENLTRIHSGNQSL